MSAIDHIIINRSRINHLANQFNVSTIKLYGAALYRKETPDHPSEFLITFDPGKPYRSYATYELQYALERLLNRQVSVTDANKLPDDQRAALFWKAVDLMDLVGNCFYMDRYPEGSSSPD